MTKKRALLSVSDKTGIIELAKFLHENGVEIISTGGTMKAIKDAGIPKEMYEGYEKYGGTPHLDWRFTYNGHTVFGQVYEGLDVVDNIAAVAVDSNSTFQESFTTTHSGKVEIKNNQVSYLPGKDYNGDDVVYYVVANKNANENKYSVARVDVKVTPENDQPVFDSTTPKSAEMNEIFGE